MVKMDDVNGQVGSTGGDSLHNDSVSGNVTPVRGGISVGRGELADIPAGNDVQGGSDVQGLEELPGSNDVQGYEVEALAQLLAEQAKDDQLLLGYLANQLGSAWPEAVQVKKAGLMGRGAISEVVVILEEEQFSISKQHGRLVPTVAKVMGGIAIRHDTITVAEWTERLAERLSGEADKSEEARQALLRLVT